MREGKNVLELVRKQREPKEHSESTPNIKDVLEETQKEMSETPIPMSKEGQELANTLNRNRFWLGEDMYSEIEKYLAASEDYQITLATGDDKKIKDAEKKREQSRATVTKIREMLLKE